MRNHEVLMKENPEPYEGLISLMPSEEVVSVVEAANLRDVGNIIKRFGQWAVTDFGVECLMVEYRIHSSRLNALDWPEHVSEKRWCGLHDRYDLRDSIIFAKDYFRNASQTN